MLTKYPNQTEQVSGLQYDMSQEEDYHTSHNFAGNKNLWICKKISTYNQEITKDAILPTS